MTGSGTFSAGSGAADLLSRPLQFVKGVGPVRAGLLQRLHLETFRDLIFHFPIAHKDRASITPISRLRAGAEANIVAQIIDVRGRRFAGKEKVEALLQDSSGNIRAGWWNPYVADKLLPNAWGFFSGKVKLFNDKRELAGPEFEILQESDENDESSAASFTTGPSFGRIVPVYNLRPKQRLPSGEEAPEIRINQNFLRKLIWQALESGAAACIPDLLPPDLVKKMRLMPLPEAVRQFHFPDSFAKAEAARRRLVFEELFIISTGVALRRVQIETRAAARRMPLVPAIQSRIKARLPFELTPSQAQVFSEIAHDMNSTQPMNRLLQGDVGSGKTAVAVSALLLCVAHGGQAALLAPTEVLAEQHFRTLCNILQKSRVTIALLRGASTEAERREFLRKLDAGEIHIAVGTHALLEPDVTFKNLGLVVVDEQHKFGVDQRRALRNKGIAPHVLVMTATPIPRTLTLTLYGDLDVSRIDQPPPGRGEIVTKWLKEVDRPKVYKLMIDEARKGHASYVVLPRIDSESPLETAPETPLKGAKAAKARAPKKLWSEVKGVEEEVKRLREHLPTLRLEMLHGRMPGPEKDRVLTLLREGKIDVIVSTQVIEVGIDLPTATLMVIENAEMFGLSALHQLRGRVGRSERKSYCIIFGEPTTEETEERLKVFCKTRDGFEIAEADFRIRGPGQFFGTAQSGMPELKIADLLRDVDVLAEARAEALERVRRDPQLRKVEHAGLKARVKEVLGSRLGLIDVG
ncbi:MAG TPA: ATP-dependent DNA helicase RecG [Planctomycetota bacterium]|nr:ATP-dependent DNA helicase RecG [Planctomycetota bacterium]